MLAPLSVYDVCMYYVCMMYVYKPCHVSKSQGEVTFVEAENFGQFFFLQRTKETEDRAFTPIRSDLEE